MRLYEHRHTFHSYRYKPAVYSGPLQRLWHLHDQHPLPPALNRAGRLAIYYARRLRAALTTPPVRDGKDEFGDPVVPRQRFLSPAAAFEPPPLAAVEARFRYLHDINEYLYNGDGSWEQHEHTSFYGSGIPIEDVAFRVLGYLGAHAAFGDPVFLRRAEEGAGYLLRERVFADGHVRLESHLVVELTYSFAARALLAMWAYDRRREDCLDAARRIGDRLVEEHATGCVDHAVMPAQVLAPLYRITGEERYLRAALTRVMRYAVAQQLPYGGWAGEDGFIWYHSIILKSVIAAYVATPNTLAHYTKKDRMARCVTAALNRSLAAQDAAGQIKLGRGTLTKDYNFTRHCVAFDGERLVPAPSSLERYAGEAELDALMSAFDELNAQPAARAAHGYAAHMLRRGEVRRADFETAAIGRYAAFLTRLSRRSRQLRRAVGAPADGEVACRAVLQPRAASWN